MKSTKSILAALTALVGLAMLATPITAAAAEHHRGFVRARRQEARAIRAAGAVPVRPFAATPRAYRNARLQSFVPVAPVRPVGYLGRGYRGYNYSAAPAYSSSCNRPVTNSGIVCDEDGDDCHQAGGYQGGYTGNYGYNNNYNAAPAYAYGGGGANSNACVQAQRLANQYRRDRNSGHPAAAQDVARAMRRAEIACQGGGAYNSYAPANSGLLGGLLGPQQYANYGANNGYGNGYNNGYANPGYGNGAGSTLLPLVQQFIR